MEGSELTRRDEWKGLIDDRQETLVELLGMLGGSRGDPEMAERARWLEEAYVAFFDDLRRYVDFCEDRLEGMDV